MARKSAGSAFGGGRCYSAVAFLSPEVYPPKEMPFRFHTFDIAGLVLVETQFYKDERGYLVETYKHSEFMANGISEAFVQDIVSRSNRGTLRGLHFQRHPQAQGKLISVARGAIFDVSVDVRIGSPTFLAWHGLRLEEQDGLMLYVPPGFAHGFCALSEVAEVAYKQTAEYAPSLEGGIVWNDPDIGVAWPVTEPILSPRDVMLPRWRDANINFFHSQAP